MGDQEEIEIAQAHQGRLLEESQPRFVASDGAHLPFFFLNSFFDRFPFDFLYRFASLAFPPLPLSPPRPRPRPPLSSLPFHPFSFPIRLLAVSVSFLFPFLRYLSFFPLLFLPFPMPALHVLHVLHVLRVLHVLPVLLVLIPIFLVFTLVLVGMVSLSRGRRPLSLV